jgi:hypothetical protein
MACFGGMPKIAHGVGSYTDPNIRMTDVNMGHSSFIEPGQQEREGGCLSRDKVSLLQVPCP